MRAEYRRKVSKVVAAVLSDEQEAYGGQTIGLKHLTNPRCHENQGFATFCEADIFIYYGLESISSKIQQAGIIPKSPADPSPRLWSQGATAERSGGGAGRGASAARAEQERYGVRTGAKAESERRGAATGAERRAAQQDRSTAGSPQLKRRASVKSLESQHPAFTPISLVLGVKFINRTSDAEEPSRTSSIMLESPMLCAQPCVPWLPRNTWNP